jgi:peptidyl-prolyl cis-trans isomerase A (cyclophilin A)
MRTLFRACTLLLALAAARPVTAEIVNPVVRFTVLGSYSMDVELFEDQVPTTVQNFLSYVNGGSYRNTFFHRSTTANPNDIQVVQGGGFTINQNVIDPIATTAPIALEAGIPNTRGTIAMARGEGPNTATCQWFFNVTDNPGLDPNANPLNPDGYAVFGRIVSDVLPPLNVDSSGLALLDAIAALQTFNLNPEILGPLYPNPNDGPFGTVPLVVQNQQAFFVTVNSVAAVPEPSSMVLAAGGIALAVAAARRKRRTRPSASLETCATE